MARKLVVVFKRPTTRKNRYSYYVKIWDDIRKQYLTPRSAASLVKELRLDEQEFPSNTRNGACKIGEAYFRFLTTKPTTEEPLFIEYLEKFWNWETSPYIEAKRARGQRIGMEYVKANASYVRNYIAGAFPELKLAEVRPYMLENFIMDLVKKGKVSNRTANAIIDAFKIPLKEAFRQGITQSDPAANIRKFSRNSKPKGIPSDEEIAGLIRQATDLRIRCAVMDLFNRQIVSYTLSRRNTTATALNPILALASSYDLQGTLVHCDRGPAYRSEAYQALLRNHGIVASYSRAGNCWDNALMECFFGHMKCELGFVTGSQRKQRVRQVS